MHTLLKTLFFAILLIAHTTFLFAHDGNQTSNTLISGGIGIGTVLAIVICWDRTNSVLTSFFAGIFGWLYVIYFLIIRENEKD